MNSLVRKINHLSDPAYIKSRLNTKLNDLFELPNIISIEVSSKCNLKCVTCSLREFGEHENMSLETFCKLKKIFSKFHYISLSNSGEPLMNRDLIEMIKLIKEESPVTKVGFNTNGTLLNRDLAVKFVTVELDEIIFSLDGATKETFEKIRLGAKYDLVYKNMFELQEVKRSLKKDNPVIGICMVLTKDNYQELPQLIEIAHKLGISKINVNGLEPYDETMKEQILYSKNEIEKKIEYIYQEANKKAKLYNIKMVTPNLRFTNIRQCNAIKAAIISSKGEVRPCSPLMYKRNFYWFGDKKEHCSISFGNINIDDFYKIWKSKNYRVFRNNIRKNRFPVECNNCLMSYGVICP